MAGKDILGTIMKNLESIKKKFNQSPIIPAKKERGITYSRHDREVVKREQERFHKEYWR